MVFEKSLPNTKTFGFKISMLPAKSVNEDHVVKYEYYINTKDPLLAHLDTLA